MINNKKGFTLIELLVVIAIIAILSSVVLASLNSARTKARDAKRISDIKQIQLALEMSYDTAGSYPAALTAATLVTPGYISAIPLDPVTGAGYSYAGLGSGSCTSYHLGATLEADGPVLDSDSDAAAGTACTGSAADFTAVAGDADLIFDVKP